MAARTIEREQQEDGAQVFEIYDGGGRQGRGLSPGRWQQAALGMGFILGMVTVFVCISLS
jgi:hypothetical protein